MGRLLKILPARFFQTASGIEPVRVWLKTLDKADRSRIGTAICKVELGWPIGMPVCRAIVGRKDLWEVRCKITRERIARVIFTITDGKMILLHGFVKKTQKTEKKDLDLAAKRKREHEQHG